MIVFFKSRTPISNKHLCLPLRSATPHAQVILVFSEQKDPKVSFYAIVAILFSLPITVRHFPHRRLLEHKQLLCSSQRNRSHRTILQNYRQSYCFII